MHFGPVAVSFPPVTSRHFRVLLTNYRGTGELTELELSGKAKLESYVEKQLGKMFQSPQPPWNFYLWPPQAEPDQPGLAVDAEKIINLSDKVAADGTVTWDAPAGDWVLRRAWPTGVRNGPTSPEGSGYESDKVAPGLATISTASWASCTASPPRTAAPSST